MPVFKVGMISYATLVEAPTAEAAVLFYGLWANTNNPFMVAVYEEDGKEYEGNSLPLSGLAFAPDEEEVKAKLAELEPLIKECSFVVATQPGQMNGKAIF